ncbi:hypothetical protein RDWZM_009541 [Blomia tropicalis]|uniref:L-dopachrome isomerase n=1 Tax=Blomia tropicalis TaxID=40697 RepID=A0A9Q0M3M1_BLOTA|nr:hypothetical protein BLOT_011768 [Blomia tropicalis]KAJ6218384.1 hypothetical protein RDWZM_009541 [Blomia tropicalis]
MPFLQLFTTLSRSQVPENLGQVLAQTLSTTMRNKPLERICVHISTDQLIFSGSHNETNGPLAYGVLRSIGSVELEDNRRTVEAITRIIHEQLKVPQQEIRFLFDDYSPEKVAMNGKVVTDILAGK